MPFKDYVPSASENYAKQMDELAPALIISYGIDPPILTGADPFSILGKGYAQPLPFPPFPGMPNLGYVANFFAVPSILLKAPKIPSFPKLPDGTIDFGSLSMADIDLLLKMGIDLPSLGFSIPGFDVPSIPDISMPDISIDILLAKFGLSLDALPRIPGTDLFEIPKIPSISPIPIFPGVPIPPLPALKALLKLALPSIGPIDLNDPDLDFSILTPELLAPDIVIDQQMAMYKFFLNFANDIKTNIITQLCTGLVSITAPVVMTPVGPTPPGPPAVPIPLSVSSATCFLDSPAVPIDVKMGYFNWAVDLIPPPTGIPRLAGKIPVVP